MIEVKTGLKRWGRSYGVIIPMKKVKQENLKEREMLRIIITRQKNPLAETFGILKGQIKKSTQVILDESDRESWDE